MNTESHYSSVITDDLSVTLMDIENQTAKFDLTLFMEHSPNGIKGAFEYNTDLFDMSSISRMIEDFQALVQGIITDPEEKISEFTFKHKPPQKRVKSELRRVKEEDISAFALHKPANPIEEKVASVWAEVLTGDAKNRVHSQSTARHSGKSRNPAFGSYDDFFALGGHSLLAAQVVSRLNDEFQIRLSVRHVFDYPTISELSACIEMIQGRSDAFRKILETSGEEGEI